MQPDIGPVCSLHLEFMKWADNAVLSALSQLPTERIQQDLGNSFKSMFGTLCHIYLAEQVWFERVNGKPDAKLADLQSPADLTALSECWPELHRGWLDWANSIGVAAWSQPLLQKNSQGTEFRTPIWQIVMHLVNHGSYHRGQITTMLRQSGATPPGTDLITFYRTR
jgi:uncharacterized damage-inducible protein DinB